MFVDLDCNAKIILNQIIYIKDFNNWHSISDLLHLNPLQQWLSTITTSAGTSLTSVLKVELEPFDISVIEYISGYIVKKVALSTNCIKCFNYLLNQNDEENLFTSLKERYLLHPRKEIVKIFKICERKMKEIRDGNIILSTNCLVSKSIKY